MRRGDQRANERPAGGLRGWLLRATTGLLWRLAEVGFSLGLAALFFLGFLGIYTLSFPDGTQIGELVRSRSTAPEQRLRASVEVREDPKEDSFVALLSDVLRAVKEKPPGAIAWSDAARGTPLAERHAVQSFADSSATIRFDEQSALQLGENSLIVVRAARREVSTGQRRTTLVLLGGQLHGQLGRSAERLQVDIATAASTLHVDSAAGQEPTEFTVASQPDQSAIFTVTRGQAEVRVGHESVRIGPDQSVTVDAAGRLQPVQRLAPAPLPLTPADGTKLVFRLIPPEVRFSWTAEDAAATHRLVLARDREQREIAFAQLVTGDSFVHGNLSGSYYWTVHAVRGGAVGPASAVRRLTVVADREPPLLRVAATPPRVDAPQLSLTGETEPAAELFVDDEKLRPDSTGKFAHQVALRPGLNVIIVEAVDAAGNSSYESRLVQARYETSERIP